jgi:predicted nucleic acid-binding protein
LHHDDVFARVGPMFLSGQIATCGIVDLEVLYSARSGEHHAALYHDQAMLPRVPVGERGIDRAITVQGLLADAGKHRAVPIIDLLLAAAAELSGLTVLHYDADFDLIADVTGQPCEWVVPRGTVP